MTKPTSVEPMNSTDHKEIAGRKLARIQTPLNLEALLVYLRSQQEKRRR